MRSQNGFQPSPDDIAAYLRRLGVDHPGVPSLSALRALHRAHVDRVPYEALDIQVGRPTSVHPREAISRILRGRGGYCVQLNSAFSTLLAALGYDVTWRPAGVQVSASSPPPGTTHAPHLAPTVALDGEEWLADIGLGDALIEPLPLRSGVYRQGVFTFRLAPSRTEPGGWRFNHDPRGSVAGMDVAMSSAGVADFERWHDYLATAPESRLVRTVMVMRRDEAGADSLTGCMLRRVDATGKTVRELTTADDWYGALADVFDLTLEEIGETERAALWSGVRAAHEAWLAAKARSTS
jgi:arylamine N-acetyltransferase